MVAQQPQNETKQVLKTESEPGDNLAVPQPVSPSPYQPLSEHIDCTRLVRIEPAKKDDDPIICSLVEAEFRERPKFDALSYMWGDGPAQCNIILNGVIFGVRENLRDALRYLRTQAADTSYWIDAICINQAEVRERNRQVLIMHHIYFRAKTVLVWLGKRYAEYETSIPGSRVHGQGEPSNGQPELESSADWPKSGLPATQQPKGDAERRQQRRMAEELYNDGYWNRLWIVQEIGCARNIKVCFGNSAANWDHFIYFIAMHTIGSQGPVKLNRLRQGRYSGSNSLLRLLQDHREALCQDSKDKVYGLVGMASDAGGFVIDYQKSAFEIWTDVMEFMNRRGLFADEDIVSVGGLVKSLLMGTNCLPLQQILRQYAPRKGDSMTITRANHVTAFELPAAMLGCVISVGPRPQEIVGNFRKLDEWTKQVQANYKNDLGPANKESDTLVLAILDLDDISLSKKCFDCESIIEWSVRLYTTNQNQALEQNSGLIQALRSGSNDQLENKNSSAEQAPANNSRLFQMDNYMGQTPWKMGLASSDIRLGDLICWLGSPRRAIVIRPSWQGNDYPEIWRLQVVGTAVVTEDLMETCLSRRQRAGWDDGRLKQTVYLDATTIFVLLE